MGAKTDCLKVKLSVQREIYSCLEGDGVESKYFRSSYASTATLHKDGYQNHIW